MQKTKNDIWVVAVTRPIIPETQRNGTLADSMVSAGFPSPAEEPHETFDIVSHIVRHPAATFLMRIACDSMMWADFYAFRMKKPWFGICGGHW
jgi:SOS-response transcriptional repressor LexA